MCRGATILYEGVCAPSEINNGPIDETLYPPPDDDFIVCGPGNTKCLGPGYEWDDEGNIIAVDPVPSVEITLPKKVKKSYKKIKKNILQ